MIWQWLRRPNMSRRPWNWPAMLLFVDHYGRSCGAGCGRASVRRATVANEFTSAVERAWREWDVL
ncbi:MAG: hypothetical protein CM1200mP2_56930 [Planctomycetaceae bacterium]|nr:MAG: hypothetical protein CM1200mP2_56930 [Planctomycetaceae bacterium]